jgi:hypothetical protein
LDVPGKLVNNGNYITAPPHSNIVVAEVPIEGGLSLRLGF